MTKYLAIDPNGFEHRRTTAGRTYTHTVVYQRSKEWAVAQAKASHEGHVSTGKYFLDCVAVGYHAYLMHFDHYRNDIARQQADVAESLESLAGMTTAEGYAAAQVAKHLLDIDARDWSAYLNAGWCGRRDLAEKLAAATRSPHTLNVTVLEAREV